MITINLDSENKRCSVCNRFYSIESCGKVPSCCPFCAQKMVDERRETISDLEKTIFRRESAIRSLRICYKRLKASIKK